MGMNLDDAQRQKVSQWIEEGLSLSKIQDKLASEFGLRLTYMELRFLIDDLGMKLKDVPREAPAQIQADKATPPAPSTPSPGDLGEKPSPGGVSVTVDQVTRPGAMVSGKVNFSDGKTADWYLDQMGRLGLVPKETGYKPSQDDIVAFQAELQSELARQGF
jgi:hypothetical protein